jgi:3-hexulose-6-phosphate synthase
VSVTFAILINAGRWSKTNALIDKPRLQVAIDTLNVEEALALAEQLRATVDLIEAGTPFIKRFGINVVMRLQEVSGLPIVADLKIVDGGPFEAQLAVDAGAALVTVLATANDATIRGVVETAHAGGLEVASDLLGVHDLPQRIGQLERLGVDYLGVHAGTDARLAGRTDLMSEIGQVTATSNMPLVVAGGLNAHSIPGVLGYHPSIVVVGSAITTAPDPSAAAREIRSVIDG